MSDVRLAVARTQLARMRAMTALYHRRFFADVWLTVAVYMGVFAAAEFGAVRLNLALAFIALFGAVITSFDASYLVFARQYAARLESFINDELGTQLLVGAHLENAYLFPLDARKVVTIRAGRGFSWFGFVTLFFTILGITGYIFGVFSAIETIDTGAGIFWYLAALTPLTAGALTAGLWWFPVGTGEARLRTVLDERFARTSGGPGR